MPDELYDQVSKSDVNVSQICQEALNRAVMSKEKIRIDGDKMQALKEKIMKEKEDYKTEMFNAGRDIAKKWAEENSLSYEDFQHADKNNVTDNTKEQIKDELDRFDYSSDYDIEIVVNGFTHALVEIKKQLEI